MCCLFCIWKSLLHTHCIWKVLPDTIFVCDSSTNKVALIQTNIQVYLNMLYPYQISI